MVLRFNPRDYYSSGPPRQATGEFYDALSSPPRPTGDFVVDASTVVDGIQHQIERDPMLSDYTKVPGQRPSPEGPSMGQPPINPESPPNPDEDGVN